MTRDQAIENALEYAKIHAVAIGPMVDARYYSIEDLDTKAAQCPPDLIETYRSVRRTFRNHWAVAFKIPGSLGEVSCPESRLLCVFDSGEVSPLSSP